MRAGGNHFAKLQESLDQRNKQSKQQDRLRDTMALLNDLPGTSTSNVTIESKLVV